MIDNDVEPSNTWEYKPLKRVLKSLISGSRPKGGAQKEGIPSLGGEHINWDGTFNFSNMRYIPEEYYETMKRGKIKTEDILLVKDGATIGKVAYVDKIPFGRAAVNEHLFILRTNEKNHSKYVYHFLESEKAQYLISRVTTGSAQPGINTKFADHVTIPVPPFVEQCGIVEVLGTMDECIRLTDAVIERAEALKRGLLQQLLTRGLGHTEYKETPLGKIPKTWIIKKYNEICDEITVGIVVKPAQYYTESGVPCLRSLNILEDHIIPSDLVYISEKSNTLLKKSKVQKGDIVTIRTGKPGASAVIDDDFNGCNIIDLIISKPKKEVNPHYLSKYLLISI